MTDSTNFSAIRARLRYTTIDEFVEGYGRFVSQGGMFLPMAPQKLKPVGTTVRFQFLLADGSSAFLGEGVVRQLKGLESGEDGGPVGMLVRFTKLSPESKGLVERIVAQKQKSLADEDIQSFDEVSAPREGSAPAEAAEGESAAEPVEEPADEADFWVASREQGAQIFTQAPSPKAPTQEAQTVEAELDDEESEPAEELFESSGAEIFDSNLFAEPAESDLFAEPEESEPVQEPEPDFFGAEDFGFAAPSKPELDLFGAREEMELSEPAAANAPSGPEFDFFGDDDFGLSAPSEGDAFSNLSEPSSEASEDGLSDFQAAEIAPEPEPEPEPREVIAEPKPIKETEAGIRVMSFDGQELDDQVARELEEFALGGGEEFDEVFDNIFGGGDGDDFFGGSWGEQEAPEQEKEEPAAAAVSEVEEVFEAEAISDAVVVEELEEELREEPEEDFFAFSAPEEKEEPKEQEEDEELFEPLSEEVPPPPQEPDLPPVSTVMEESLSVDEEVIDDPAASEKILSLLDMEEESEPEMTLNLGAGLGEESENKDDERRSLESLFASTRKEIESKIEVEEEEDGWDILDELLGESDLPPPAATAAPFEVPVGGVEKRKKKGLMSRIFGKD